jgi:hypothetical protein
VKFGQPLLTTELSGAAGGLVGSRARGGVNYFRSRTRPGNPRTPGQTIVRFILAAIAGAWRSTLTSSQRAAWEAIAPAQGSGVDAYVASNAPRLLTGNTRLDVAPSGLSNPVSPVTVTPVVDASAHTLALDVPTDWGTAGQVSNAVFFISSPQNASRAARQFNFLYAGVTDADAFGPQVVGIPSTHPAYNALAGQVVYVRVVPMAQPGEAGEGRVGTAQEFRVVVQA